MPGRQVEVGPGIETFLPNFRDVGGYRTRGDGQVRRGKLYRSSAPVRLSVGQVAEVEGLGLRSVFDLRSRQERRLAPDVLPEAPDYFPIDVLAGASGLTPADQERLLSDPGSAAQAFQGRDARQASEQRFRELVRLPAARKGLGTIFTSLASEARRPALIHCSTGKDRTGWAIAAFLSLLEVPREHVMSDYLLSAELLEPTTQRARRAFVARGGDEMIFESLWGVRRENLEAAFDEMERTYGSVDDYFERGLGIDAVARLALREAFVGSPAE